MSDQKSCAQHPYLSKRTEWSGVHRGVHYSVSLHGEDREYRPQGTWCYYIYIHEMQIPAELRERFDLPARIDTSFGRPRVVYDYMSAWFAGLDWHCGITYYAKKGGLDGEPKCFKLGCDYAHYWDEGRYYDLEMVALDARHTIDRLLELVPLLTRCSWCGNYATADKVQPWGDGWIEHSCIEKRNAACPESEPIVLVPQPDTGRTP